MSQDRSHGRHRGRQTGLGAWLMGISGVMGLWAMGMALQAGAQSGNPSTQQVKSGQGILHIASAVQERSAAHAALSLDQWAMALFAANREAFGPDLHSLRQGARLHIPSPAQARELVPMGEQWLRDGDTPALRERIALVLEPREVALSPRLPADWETGAAEEAQRPVQVDVAASQGVYAVAAQWRDRDQAASLHQWALALYAANPESFGPDLNSLQKGAKLRLPPQDEVLALAGLGQQMLKQGKTETLKGKAAALLAPIESASPAEVGDPALSAEAEDRKQTSDMTASADAPVAEESVPAGAMPGANSEAEIPDESPAPGQGAAQAEPVAAAEAEETEPPLLEGAGTSESFRRSELYRQALSVAGGPGASALLPRLAEAESRYAGDPDFDYLYGVILLDANEPSEALYALQRASQRSPGDLGIRLDLGRAYFALNENESARLIFHDLAQRQPPAEAAAVIDSYLKAIEARAARYENRLSGHLALDLGHDSNANSATSLDQFAGFSLDERSRSTESAYTGLEGQLDWAAPLSPRWRWGLGGLGRYRLFWEADHLNTSQWGLNSHLAYRAGDWGVGGALQGGQTLIDGDENNQQQVLSLFSHWQQQPYLWRASLRAQRQRFADELSVRDVDQWLLAAGGLRSHGLWRGGDVGLDLLWGNDEAAEDSSPYGRDLWGLSLRLNAALTASWHWDLVSNWLESDYDGLFAGSAREDEQWFTDTGLSFRHPEWGGWDLRMGLSYTDNQSSVELFEYDRWTLGLRTTWHWR